MFIRFIVLTLLISSEAFCQEVYKYKDESGKWVFTDRRPSNKNDNEFDIVEYKREVIKPAPRVFSRSAGSMNILVADNPYHAPVEFLVKSSRLAGGSKKYVVPAASQKDLYTSPQKIGSFRYRWRLGDPSAREDGHLYKFPVSSKLSHKITQGFNGRFSHSKLPNINAIDIALPVGTDISAARDGVVIWVKDDYHMGGKNKYFLDKANYVKVLHEDGTYATYAHILIATATVKPGDIVKAGDVLARSGSSGYSTGPHLHFVIRKNVGLKTVSIPFRFISDSGITYTPKKGMVIDPLL
ncbi:M23 family metallopeptidase [Neptunomonas concharum]|uniref:M23 family metallopeptidase n=1 Tax=Neptunomonas concharum TaxID=1031538 RepID=A0A5P1R9X1_9GAMM|nr:M23 family metallopeptidase [Neptunomonas concharum]QEQ96449.1 M23 family metallopeptidase [Neptunomonas concharum]